MRNITRRTGLIVIAAFLLLSLSVVSLWAAPPTNRVKPGEILVKFKPGAPADKIVREHKASTRKVIPKIDVRCLRLPPGLTVETAVEQFKKNPNVEFATPNHVIRATYLPDDVWFEFLQWNLYNTAGRHDVHAPEAWNITTGSSSTVIAIVDTGIDDTHPDLAGKVLQGYNAIDGTTNTYDDHMHGTFVGSIAAAWTDNAEGIAGMNWNAQLLPIKVLSGSGYGDEADAADGIIWAVDQGVKILNMSLGAYDDGTNPDGLLALEAACAYAWNAGCVLVAAAGNDGLDDAVDPHYPSYYPSTLSVGGTDDTDARWLEVDPFSGEILGGSNYGDTLDVMAPASMITGAVPMWYYYDVGTLLGDAYEIGSGTSAAAPLVSGTVALLWGEHPSWTNQQIVDQIKASCDDLGATGPDRDTGWGRLNAYRALDEAYEDYPTIAALRDLPLDSNVRLVGKTVVAGTDTLTDRFFIEESDRSSGLMVHFDANPPTATTEGDLVDVIGRLALVGGQLAISNPKVTVTGTAAEPIKALGVRNGNVGGRPTSYGGVTDGIGLVNTGMLVKTWGKVTAVGSTYQYFYIDDGSRLDDGSGLSGLRVSYGNWPGWTPPAKNDYVAVTGISTVVIPEGTEHRAPVVRLRTQADVHKLN